MALLREGGYGAGLVNIGSNVAFCLGATWLGMVIGKIL